MSNFGGSTSGNSRRSRSHHSQTGGSQYPGGPPYPGQPQQPPPPQQFRQGHFPAGSPVSFPQQAPFQDDGYSSQQQPYVHPPGPPPPPPPFGGFQQQAYAQPPCPLPTHTNPATPGYFGDATSAQQQPQTGQGAPYTREAPGPIRQNPDLDNEASLATPTFSYQNLTVVPDRSNVSTVPDLDTRESRIQHPQDTGNRLQPHTNTTTASSSHISPHAPSPYAPSHGVSSHAPSQVTYPNSDSERTIRPTPGGGQAEQATAGRHWSPGNFMYHPENPNTMQTWQQSVRDAASSAGSAPSTPRQASSVVPSSSASTSYRSRHSSQHSNAPSQAPSSNPQLGSVAPSCRY
ncbi:hypothetical protein QBC35DRAFT_538973 [Podospora australis]|uniref:Uncharacterized protein n=1 Tax=Podospora australis TaxID=1536484 RepID=A0AAN6X1B3_9PEZI|nr:hypothetical protein QBC35DRAFT_538973 [Podospora australis]